MRNQSYKKPTVADIKLKGTQVVKKSLLVASILYRNPLVVNDSIEAVDLVGVIKS
jgi:hypothetical protein